MDLDLVLLVLVGLSSARSASVFLDPDQAHRVLSSGPVLVRSNRAASPGPGPVLVRTRRSNSGSWEELQRGDLKRECLEEICSFEEAREVFEHTETTNEFWKTYRVQNSCASGPCLNGGTCMDLGHDFTCLCPQDFSGLTCDLDDRAARRRCLVDNGGCDHFCEEQEAGPKCTCADGYHLDEDQLTCRNTEPIACGMVPVLQGRSSPSLDPRSRIVGGLECPRGECPWTVLLRHKGKGFCGGVFLSPDWVLTAAHCLEDTEQRHLQAVAGEHDVDVQEGSEQVVQVSEVHVHERYEPRTADNDIALLRLATPLSVTSYAVPVCLPTLSNAHFHLLPLYKHVVSGWGRVYEAGPTSRVLKRLEVPLVRTQTCQDQTGLVLTQNMLCAGYLGSQQDSCKGDSGGPLVTRYRKTWFLSGMVSWGRGCARPGQYGVYTRIGNYVDWIRTKAGVGPGAEDKILKIHETREEPGQNQTQTREEPGQNQTQTRAEPDQSQTRAEPGQNQTQTRAEPGQNQTQTRAEPDQSQTQTRAEPGQSQTQTRAEPDQNQTRAEPDQSQTRAEPGQNQTQTRAEPGQNQTQTRAEPDQSQTQTRAEPGQSQTQTRAEPDQNQTREEPGQSQTQTRAEPGQNQTRAEPGQNQTRAEPGQSQTQTREKLGQSQTQTRAEPGQNQTQTRAEPGQNQNLTITEPSQNEVYNQTESEPHKESIYNETTAELDQNQTGPGQNQD